MMTTDTGQGDLFPDIPVPPTPPPAETDSYTVRLTRRRNAELARGIHPTTRVALANNNETCATCIHVFAHHVSRTYWKCDQVEFTFGPGSDVRLSWPACTRWKPTE